MAKLKKEILKEFEGEVNITPDKYANVKRFLEKEKKEAFILGVNRGLEDSSKLKNY